MFIFIAATGKLRFVRARERERGLGGGWRENKVDKGWRVKGLKKATECELLGTTSWIKLLKQTSQSGAWMCHVYGSCISRQSFCCCCRCCLFFVGVVVFKRITSTFRFTSTEARWLIRDGDGEGGGEERTKEWRLDRGYRPKQTGETVDRRQNNGSALRNCCFNRRAWAVTRTMSVALLLRNNSKRKKSNFRSPSPPPTHDLFWAYLNVQLHLPPLGLLIFWSRLEPCKRIT